MNKKQSVTTPETREPASKVLTVVIPAYNMEKYLRRCLDSLIVSDEQMQILEVLVINDGSKDSSSQIAHEYQDRYPQTFRVIDKENGNYGSCVNRGLDEATGKYFRLLDADDQFDKVGFPKFIDALTNTDADMVLTHMCRIIEGKEGKRYYNKRPVNIQYGEVYRAQDFNFTEFSALCLFSMHSITYRTAVLHVVDLRLQTGISYTDNEYVYFPLKAVKTILPSDILLYILTRGREGQTMSASSRVKNVNNLYKVSRRIFDDVISCAENKNNSALRDKHMLMMECKMGEFFQLVLCKMKRGDEDEHLKEFYEDIKRYAPDLLVGLRNKRVSRFIKPWFCVWEESGKHMTDFPYNVLCWTVISLRRIIKKEKIVYY